MRIRSSDYSAGTSLAQNLHLVAAIGQPRGEAGGTCLGRRRRAEHRRASAQHVGAVGHDDDEVHDRHERHEVDDRRDERAEVDSLPVQGPAETLVRWSRRRRRS